jgi:hypothetical protein
MHAKLRRGVQRREAVERIAQRFIESVIRKEKGEYCVRSPNNPDWNGGCYPTEEEAEDRLKEVEFFKRQAASARWIQRSDKRYEADVGFLTLKVWKNKASDTGWSWDVAGATLPHPGHAQKASVEEAQREAIEYCQQELGALQRTLTALRQ